MLQFKFLTEQDRRESAAIARRRAAEEERRQRIFNTRNRRFGVTIKKAFGKKIISEKFDFCLWKFQIDVEALEKQVAEKKKQLLEEKQLEDQYDQQRIRDDRLALLLSKKQEQVCKLFGYSITCGCLNRQSLVA